MKNVSEVAIGLAYSALLFNDQSLAAEVERQLAFGVVALKIHPVHGGFPANARELYPAYALCEAFDWHEGLSRTFRQAKGFYVVLGGSMLAGLLIHFSPLDPIRALYYAAILNGLAAPPLILLMFVLGRDRAVMGEHRSGRVSTVIVGLTIVVSVVIPLVWLATS